MKKNFYKITAILFAAVLFMGCKGKSSEFDESRPFSIVGLRFTTKTGDETDKVPLYENSTLDMHIVENEYGNEYYGGYYEPIEYLDGGMKCQILSYDFDEDMYRQSAYVNGKKTAGWVPLHHYGVIFDKKILFASIKAALEGNNDAICMLNSRYSEITVEEAVENVRYIIDYVGVERFKKLKPYQLNPHRDGNDEDSVIVTAIASLLDNSDPRNYRDKTNPLHLLAEVANKDTWEFLEQKISLMYFFRNAIFDSEGMSVQMHAVKAKNFDTLEYFYELGENNRDDKEKISQLIKSTKDKNGKSLADYVAECDDEKIKNFMAVYEPESKLSVDDCLKYLRGLEDWRNFQMLRVLYAPVPYTTYKVLGFVGNDSFVYLTNENDLMTYGENLNIRDSQGKSGKVIGKLPYGTQVKVLEKGNEKVTIDKITDFWYKVSANGLEGWCFGGYLANPVKYKNLEELKGDDEKLNDIYQSRLPGAPAEWLYQVDFEDNTPTVIKETKLLNPKGDEITVKPLEKVEILEKIEGNSGENLWDYGMQDTNYSRQYFYRYNYYLVRTKDFKMGIIGGSALAHSSMSVCYNGPDVPVGGCESPYDFYFRLLYDRNRTKNYRTKYYAELYEVSTKTGESHFLDTGERDGPGFEIKPAYLGETSERVPSMIEFIAYRDFDMAPYSFFDEPTEAEPFYTFIFETTLDGEEVSYNSYTVRLNSRIAYNSLYKLSYDTAGMSETNYFRYSYSYFESENRKHPECIFGEFEMYSERNGENKCMGHKIDHLSLDPMTMTYTSTQTENRDYAPEW